MNGPTATKPATPAIKMLVWFPWAVATPSTRLDVERMPSLAPNTAARSQPMRPMRCRSFGRRGMLSEYRLNPAEQEKDEKDCKHQPQSATWGVTPLTAMVPSRQSADQHQHQNYDQDGSEHTFLLSLDH